MSTPDGIPTYPPNAIAALSTPVASSQTATGTSTAFTPDLNRPIWVRLSGTWVGTVQLMRSTDGTNWFPITSATGVTKGLWSANVNAPITQESVSGATYRLSFTMTSGQVDYEVRQ